jgi:hypothetical protein
LIEVTLPDLTGAASVRQAQEAKQLRDEIKKLRKLVADLSLNKEAPRSVAIADLAFDNAQGWWFFAPVFPSRWFSPPCF